MRTSALSSLLLLFAAPAAADPDSVSWGRLADVYAPQSGGASQLLARDLLIGPRVPAGIVPTQGEVSRLVRVHLSQPTASARALSQLAQLEAGPVAVQGGVVPNTAAIALEFDEPLPAGTAQSVRLTTGPADSVELPVRAFVDPRSPSRLVIDPVVDELSRLRSQTPIAAAPAGLPLEQDVTLWVGDGGSGLAQASALPQIELVLRGERAENVPQALGMLDLDPPQVLGAQRGRVTSVQPLATGGFALGFRFADSGCEQTPRVGDVIRTRTHLAEVTADGSAPVGGVAQGIQVELVAGDPATFAPGAGHFGSTWDADEGVPSSCFVRFTAQAPNSPLGEGVLPESAVSVRFNEPLDAGSVSPYDGFQVRNQAVPSSPVHYVVGEASLSGDGLLATFRPAVPLAHANGAEEVYFAEVSEELTDLAGNALASFPSVDFGLDADAASVESGGYVLRFNEADEDGNGALEVRGQVLFDLDAGLLKPRPVSRIATDFDSSNAVPALMIPFPQGVQGPLAALGSREMAVLRHVDGGFLYADDATHNLDVERMYWTPVGGQVVADAFSEFEILLAHSNRLPDEAVNPASLLPQFPNSGLSTTSFDGNVLEGQAQVVHPRAAGYAVNPIDLLQGQNGALMPYPLNAGSDPNQFEYFTWRDTTEYGLGAPNGAGADPLIAEFAGLIPPGTSGQQAAAGFVPTIGLPLLMEFRCFPDDTALGLNAFSVSLAVNSSARPNFRIHSTGGFNTAGQPVIKNPDLEQTPSGGFNPTSFPPGQPTSPGDNSFFPSRIDFVFRTNQAHTVWIDSGLASPDWSVAQAVEFGADAAPASSIELAFRGADLVVPSTDGDPLSDSAFLDAYGDLADNNNSGVPGDPASKNEGIAFTNGDSSWKSDLDEVDGSRFIQVRITFTGDTAVNLSTLLDALGLAYQ